MAIRSAKPKKALRIGQRYQASDFAIVTGKVDFPKPSVGEALVADAGCSLPSPYPAMTGRRLRCSHGLEMGGRPAAIDAGSLAPASADSSCIFPTDERYKANHQSVLQSCAVIHPRQSLVALLRLLSSLTGRRLTFGNPACNRSMSLGIGRRPTNVGHAT
jgi:hypothetical protein